MHDNECVSVLSLLRLPNAMLFFSGFCEPYSAKIWGGKKEKKWVKLAGGHYKNMLLSLPKDTTQSW